MSTFHLHREQRISAPVERVFEFFSDASNLQRLTPDWLHFEILTPGRVEMQVGTILQYSLRIHGIPVNWTTAIPVWEPPLRFVDVQLRGPYVLWHHEHRFEDLGGETRMIDDVHYRLPLGWIGRAVHAMLVRRDLQKIFDYRRTMIERLFAG